MDNWGYHHSPVLLLLLLACLRTEATVFRENFASNSSAAASSSHEDQDGEVIEAALRKPKQLWPGYYTYYVQHQHGGSHRGQPPVASHLVLQPPPVLSASTLLSKYTKKIKSGRGGALND